MLRLLEVNHRHQPWRSSWKMDPPEFRPLSSVCTQPKPSQIDLYRDHLGSVSVESDSAVAERVTFYISDSMSFYSTLNHNRAHCVLEKNDLGLTILYLMPVKTTKNEPYQGHTCFYRRFIKNFSTLALALSKPL
ncbi:hypothetical protein CR513_59473, partial [Mucuna pruriens]